MAQSSIAEAGVMETLNDAAEAGVMERLNAAAEAGDIDALYALIREDAYILESIDKVPFVDTPLHIAASKGHTDFAMEMVNLMPSYARKLNQDGFSPMHLALYYENTDLVLFLKDHDTDLIRVKGRNGMTPLHYIAAQENLFLLIEFLQACPQCITDVTIQHETALHIALKNNKTKAFQVLLRWLQWSMVKDSGDLEDRIVNWRDNRGDSLLHIAARMGQASVVEMLLSSMVNLKIKNKDNLTALDITKQSENREILKILRWPAMFYFFHPRVVLINFMRMKERMSIDTRNALLVVLTLVATTNIAATHSPPGGIWQGQALSNSTLPGIHVRADTNNTIEAAAPDSLEKVIMNSHSFTILWYLNTVSLTITILQILYLFPSGSRTFLLPLVLMFVGYTMSVSGISPSANGYLIHLMLLTIPYLVTTLWFEPVVEMKIRENQKSKGKV